MGLMMRETQEGEPPRLFRGLSDVSPVTTARASWHDLKVERPSRILAIPDQLEPFRGRSAPSSLGMHRPTRGIFLP